MRLLHARLRHEPVRALSPARGRRPRRASATRSPAISAAAPAIGRSSTRRSRPATARRPTASPPRPPSAPRRWRRSPTTRDLFVGDDARVLRRAGERSVARRALRPLSRTRRAGRRRDRRRPVDHQAAARPASRSSGSAASPGSTRSRRARDALAHRRGRDACTTPRRISPRLDPDLGELMRRFGSRQVRDGGTIGGNIANGSPIGDLAPALIALGARVELAPRRRDARPAARGILHRLRQAGSRPGEFVERGRRAAARPPTRLSRLQDLQALRRGHFRRMARLPLRRSRAADRRRAHRLRRHGGDAEARARTRRRALVGARLDDPAAWRRRSTR